MANDRNIPEDRIAMILGRLETDRAAGLIEFERLIEHADEERGFMMFARANNYAIKSELYMSDPVHAAVFEGLLQEMGDYRLKLMFPNPTERTKVLIEGQRFGPMLTGLRDLMASEIRGTPVLPPAVVLGSIPALKVASEGPEVG